MFLNYHILTTQNNEFHYNFESMCVIYCDDIHSAYRFVLEQRGGGGGEGGRSVRREIAQL